MGRHILLSLLLGAWVSAPAWSAFEVLGRGTRESAMSDAVIVHATDGGALWYNPAGLASVRPARLTLDYARLFPGLDVGPGIGDGSLSYTRRLAGGGVGLGLAALSAGFYSETGVVAGYGLHLKKRLDVGLAVRFLRWSADGYRDRSSGLADPDRSGSGVGVDLGARFEALTWKGATYRLGVSARNLNEPDVSQSGGTGVPRILSAGVEYEDALLVAEIDLERVAGTSLLRLGGEYKLGGRYDVRLRGGTAGMPGEGTAGKLDAGLGLRSGRLLLDYAYSYSTEIDVGGSQRVSLGYSF